MKAKIFILILFLLPGFYQVFGQGMTLEPGAKVTVKDGGKISIDGTGKITIQSTAAGSGSLVIDANVSSSVSPAGGAVVEQYLTGTRWHQSSSPVPSETSGGVYLGDYLYRWNEPTTAWVNIVETDYPLTPMQGFFVDDYPSSETEVFTGSGVNGLNNGSIGPYALTRVNDDATSGFNLVGNPYPCSVDWMLSAGWTKTRITNEFWVYHDVDGTLVNGQYAYFHGSDPPDSLLGGRRFIPATQGFWVMVIHDPVLKSAGGSLTVNNAARVHGNAAFLKNSAAPTTNSLRIKAVKGNLVDEMVVKFVKEASAGEDEFDGHKFFGGSGLPQIYSELSGNNPLCINALPDVINHVTVPLSFKAGFNSGYTLLFNQVESFSSQVTIDLEDLKLNYTQDLRPNAVYNFDYSVNDDPNRFLLHFNDAAFSIQEAQNVQDVQIYSYQDNLYIKALNNLNMKGVVTVYNMIGAELFNSNLTSGILNKFQPGLADGYYLVKVVTDNSVYSQRVFLTR